MSNKTKFISEFEDFLHSKEKGILITGTNQYMKHQLVMALFEKKYMNKSILFRTNSMGNITHCDYLGWAEVNKQPKAGEYIPIGNNYYQFDSMNNKGTWNKTALEFDFAIVYPVDSLCRNKNIEPIQELFEFKNIGKIVLCSWSESFNYDYSIFDKFISRHIVYDIENDD